jgi:hypothetical protein
LFFALTLGKSFRKEVAGVLFRKTAPIRFAASLRAACLALLMSVLAVLVVLALVSNPAAEPEEQKPYPAREHRQEGSDEFRITTLSARNDMISGGDVLVRIEVAPTVPLARVVVDRNGEEVTAAFHPSSDGQALVGLVKGLRPGDNVVAASEGGRGGPSARLTLTNYSINGPIFSGPHESPYVCMTASFRLPVTGGTLGAPLDQDCSIARRVDYVYRSREGSFKPLRVPGPRPSDVAVTATNRGRVVPYIVRVETGTVNRAVYQTAVLHDPAAEPPPTPWRQPAAWNGRLVYKFGGGCPGGWYVQGTATDGVLEDRMLSLGYATASATANVFGNNCSDLLAAETMMMVKERFIESYGLPTGTIGWGCSGGSYQAHQIGDNYPGLLDGIVVGCSFPDVSHAAISVHSFGARLLYHYFSRSAAVPWTRAQQVAVAGFADYPTLVSMATRADRLNPRGQYSDALPADLLYEPRKNPRGVRCTVYDHAVNVYGRDPRTGFARRFLDNAGVQYGLAALNTGVITPAQFLDLNEKIGGIDLDANFTPERTVGDPAALRIAYESGRILSGGGGLASLPIIDYRAYTDSVSGDLHMRFHSFSTRARLLEANGRFDNQVMLVESDKHGIWNAQSPVLQDALRQMDGWLSNLANDPSDAPRADKVGRDKPADLVDACFTGSGAKIAEPQTYGGGGACNRLYPSHASPYLVAGMPIANNVAKCRRKPIDPSDYRVALTPGEMDRLHRIFPAGVCDYTKPGIDQRPLKGTWLSFGPAGAPPSQD